MPLELGTYLSDLVASNPTGSDNKSTADDHLRLLKSTLKASFPAVAGPITKTHLELNAAHDQRVPVGGIIMWSGAQVNIPAGWLLCNGLSGTPNLLDRFVIGAGSSYLVGATGGSKDAIVAAHSHAVLLTGSAASAGSHTHGINDPGHAHGLTASVSSFGPRGGAGGDFYGAQPVATTTNAATTGISLIADGAHAHSVTASGSTDSTGASATNANLPPFYALCFIMKAA